MGYTQGVGYTLGEVGCTPYLEQRPLWRSVRIIMDRFLSFVVPSSKKIKDLIYLGLVGIECDCRLCQFLVQ